MQKKLYIEKGGVFLKREKSECKFFIIVEWWEFHTHYNRGSDSR